MRRWGFPSLLLSMGLHGALVGAGLPSGQQARAARQPELPASMATAGSSVEIEAPPEAFAAPRPEPAVESEGATKAESAPFAAVVSRPPPRVALPTRTLPKLPPKPAPISSAEPLDTAQAKQAKQAQASGPVRTGEQWSVRGVLDLGYAIARALSLAAPDEAVWREFPVGHIGTVRIALPVDDSQHLGSARRLRTSPDEPTPPAVLEQLVDDALLVMRGGSFAVSGSPLPGIERLVIDVAIRARASDEAGDSAVVQKGFSGATPARPGKAYFRYGTGCAVEAVVTVVRP